MMFKHDEICRDSFVTCRVNVTKLFADSAGEDEANSFIRYYDPVQAG